MERRTYSGSFDPAALAEYLVQHYEPQHGLQAQDLGQGGAHLVQIGRGDSPDKPRHAVTVAIAAADDGKVIVSLGQQQWLTPEVAGFGAVMALVALLVTPWVLFALIWPLTEAVGNMQLPEDVWNTIDTFAASRGGRLERTEELSHPHA